MYQVCITTYKRNAHFYSHRCVFCAWPLNSYLRWVRNDGLFTDCEVDSDCDDVEGEGVGEDLKCGLLFGQDALNGGVTEEVRLLFARTESALLQ